MHRYQKAVRGLVMDARLFDSERYARGAGMGTVVNA